MPHFLSHYDADIIHLRYSSYKMMIEKIDFLSNLPIDNESWF